MLQNKFIAVRVDDENNAEQWWDAVREQFPAFAESLSRNNCAVIHRDAWNTLAALPGFADGPEHAQTALIDCGSEGERWSDIVCGRHGMFGPDLELAFDLPSNDDVMRDIETESN